MGRRWTSSEIDCLVKCSKTHKVVELAEILNRTKLSVYQKCARLGTPAYNEYRKKVTLVCNFCGEEYLQIPANVDKSKFCSKECMNSSRKLPKAYCVDCGIELSKRKYKRCNTCQVQGELNPVWQGGDITIACDWCGKDVTKARGHYNALNNHFCDKECESFWKSEHMRGDQCYAWKGGVTSFKQAVRGSKQYRDWRKAVFERDNYTCQKTLVRGGVLQVHHKKSYSSIISEYNILSLEEALECKELWDTDNGATLEIEAHNDFHAIYGYTTSSVEYLDWIGDINE